MRLLITSDIHLTDKPRDAYRFNLFPWLLEQQKLYKPDATLVLGDLTDFKDKHSSVLVNKIVDNFKLLKPPVYINRGNHDGSSPEWPFFGFLSRIEGLTFCSEFTLIEEFKLAFIPHQLTQESFDECFKQVPKGWLVFLHQTVNGVLSNTGMPLAGLVVPDNNALAIYSGDIHAAQKCGSVIYIGAPYHTTIGDNYEPRILLLDIIGDRIVEKDFHFEAPKKLHLHIRDVSELSKLRKGDQARITMELTSAEVVEWANHKKAIAEYCRLNGVELYGAELKKPEHKKRARLEEQSDKRGKSKLEYFTSYCNVEKTPEQMREAGLRLLKSKHDNSIY